MSSSFSEGFSRLYVLRKSSLDIETKASFTSDTENMRVIFYYEKEVKKLGFI